MLRAKRGRKASRGWGKRCDRTDSAGWFQENSCLFGSLSSEWANTHPGSPVSGSKQLKGAVSTAVTNLQLRRSTIYLQEGDRINNQFLCPGRQIIHGAGGKLHNSVLRSRLPDGASTLEFQAYLINSGLFCGLESDVSDVWAFSPAHKHIAEADILIITLTSYLFSRRFYPDRLKRGQCRRNSEKIARIMQVRQLHHAELRQ